MLQDSDSDDFLDLRPLSVNGCPNAPAAAESLEPVPAAAESLEPVPAAAESVERPVPMVKGISCERTPLMHHYVCQRMRHFRTIKKGGKEQNAVISRCVQVVETVTRRTPLRGKTLACVRDGAAAGKSGKVLKRVLGKLGKHSLMFRRGQIPYTDHLDVGFDKSIRTCDAARVCNIRKKDVVPLKKTLSVAVWKTSLRQL